VKIERHNYLMIPGPTEVEPEALLAMAQPTIPHYGDDWVRINSRIIAKLKKVFQTENDMFIIPGSSSAAMEAAVNAVVEPGTEVLVELSGFLCYRFKEMVESYEGKVVPIEFEWGEPVHPEVVRSTLSANPSIKVMTLIHNVSSTGVTNPAREIAQICQEFDVILICDTVSSMGGIDIKTDEWGLDFCMCGNQKCMQTPPGLGLVSVSEKAWIHMEERKTPVQGWYLNFLNLRRYCRQWSDWHPHGPVTAPTALYAALEVALDHMLEEGLENRFKRHVLNAKALRAGLKAAGIKLFVDNRFASNTITTFIVPDGIDGKKIRKILEDEFKIMISGAPDKIAGRVLRVGHMGVTSARSWILATLTGIIYACNKLGATLDTGKALEAALDTYMSSTN